MFEQTFKNIDDILYKDAGADSELNYIGQTSELKYMQIADAKKELGSIANIRESFVRFQPMLYKKVLAI